jgi:hypothetical protein
MIDRLWGLPVVVTTAITQGTVLVGAFKIGAMVFRRKGLTVQMYNQNEDDAKKNLIMLDRRRAPWPRRVASISILQSDWDRLIRLRHNLKTQDSQVVARLAHTQQIGGSNPSPATKTMKIKLVSAVLVFAFFASPLFAQEYGKAGKIITAGGAPVNGTNEIQTVTIGGTPTAGTFKLTLNGETTGAITWSATNATLIADIDAKLEALPSVGTGGVVTAVGTMTAGIGTFTVTFSGTNVAKRPVGAMTATSSLTGTSPTLSNGVVSTPGVAPTGGGATERGTILVRTDTGDGYINQGAPPNISWIKFTP